MNTTIQAIQHIDIDKYTTIEEERNKILSDEKFQQWCKEMRIGTRVEVKDYKANELMQQYSNYPKWVSRLY
jgi:hypothetical protein